MRRLGVTVTVGAAALVLASCVSFGTATPLQASAAADARSGPMAFAHISGSAPDLLVLATGASTGDTLERLVRCGDGCLQRAQTIPLPDGGVDLAVADFNHDGIDDVVVSGHAAVHVFMGQRGTGGNPPTLATTSTVVISTLSGAYVVTGDFNHDGVPDVGALGVPDTRLITHWQYVVANGASSGGFDASNVVGDFTLPKVAQPTTLTAGDFNGDGATDAAVGIVDGSSATDHVEVFGDSALEFSSDLDALGIVAAAGDFNGDGRDDLAIVNEGCCVDSPPADVRVFRSTGTSFTNFGTAMTSLPTTSKRVGDIAIRDLDGNGTTDIVVTGTSTNNVQWWNGAGDGTFVTVNGNSRLDRAAGSAPTALALGNVGGTALPDAVVANSDQPNAQVSVLLNTSTQ